MKIFLRKIRIEKGLSYRELAELSGVSKSGIASIENGKMPRIDTLCKLAKALEVDIEDLFECE
jgi:transcriptional regulator with XRE-family HTH domain